MAVVVAEPVPASARGTSLRPRTGGGGGDGADMCKGTRPGTVVSGTGSGGGRSGSPPLLVFCAPPTGDPLILRPASRLQEAGGGGGGNLGWELPACLVWMEVWRVGAEPVAGLWMDAAAACQSENHWDFRQLLVWHSCCWSGRSCCICCICWVCC